jgi:hypothetical protein
VSELDHTIQQTWEYRETLTGELYSSAFGDADYLEGDNILGVFGFLYQEGGVDNNDLGLGDKSARVIEIARDRDDEVVWDVRFNGAADITPGGWRACTSSKGSTDPGVVPPVMLGLGRSGVLHARLVPLLVLSVPGLCACVRPGGHLAGSHSA